MFLKNFKNFILCSSYAYLTSTWYLVISLFTFSFHDINNNAPKEISNDKENLICDMVRQIIRLEKVLIAVWIYLYDCSWLSILFMKQDMHFILILAITYIRKSEKRNLCDEEMRKRKRLSNLYENHATTLSEKGRNKWKYLIGIPF